MYARAEMLSFMNRFEEALEVLDSIGRMFPAHDINDDVLLARAQIMLTRGQYEQADELLGRIVEAYPEGLLADEALFKRAELQERVFNKPEEAMALYQQLLNSYPGSLNAVAARNRFRALRDGIVN
jgi:TolA-binding protein